MGGAGVRRSCAEVLVCACRISKASIAPERTVGRTACTVLNDSSEMQRCEHVLLLLLFRFRCHCQPAIPHDPSAKIPGMVGAIRAFAADLPLRAQRSCGVLVILRAAERTIAPAGILLTVAMDGSVAAAARVVLEVVDVPSRKCQYGVEAAEGRTCRIPAGWDSRLRREAA